MNRHKPDAYHILISICAQNSSNVNNGCLCLDVAVCCLLFVRELDREVAKTLSLKVH